jgi:hypothetical protein
VFKCTLENVKLPDKLISQIVLGKWKLEDEIKTALFLAPKS